MVSVKKARKTGLFAGLSAPVKDAPTGRSQIIDAHVGEENVRICVFGVGAIGGYMAAELALAGHDVCGIGRGAHLAAIRQDGLKLISMGASASRAFPPATTRRILVRRIS